jgi:demethylmenaquinone methyltransferase / 2-methoxy-6-polyprenyl-1,4-benzoquinol methylase
MKPLTTGKARAEYVRKTFTRVAHNYQRMNSLMTLGQDHAWRREVVRLVGLKPGMRLLDLGTGTGDLARLVLANGQGVKIVAADFTLEMLLAGWKRGELPFTAADALAAPFAAESFDVVISGFLLRNVGDLDQALAEQFRLLKPGGRIVILETTRPTRNLLTPFIWLHMNVVIPLLGSLVSGNREAYEYLPQSSEQFLSAEKLAVRLEEAGFTGVGFKRRMAGTIAIHWGKKPKQ